MLLFTITHAVYPASENIEIDRAGHKVPWSVEALKSVEALLNGSTLIFPSKKPTLTVQRLILKKIMLSALKFVYFLVHVNGTTLNSFSSHLKLTLNNLFIKIKNVTTMLSLNVVFVTALFLLYSWAAATMINMCFCELLLPILNF